MLGIIALITVFIAAFFAYKTAVGNGRNGPLWTLATLGVGLGLQVVIPVVLGVILAVVYLAGGTSPEKLQEEIAGPAGVIGLVSLFVGFIAIWLILRHVSKLPQDELRIDSPPPPPTVFDTTDQTQ